MAFQREAIGAERIFACDAAIRQKFLVGMRADRAGDVFALIELGEYLHRQRAHRLEDRPWDVADDKADDGFHRVAIAAASYQKRKVFFSFFERIFLF